MELISLIFSFIFNAVSAWWKGKKEDERKVACEAAFTRQQDQEKIHVFTEQTLEEERKLTAANVAELLRDPADRNKPN